MHTTLTDLVYASAAFASEHYLLLSAVVILIIALVIYWKQVANLGCGAINYLCGTHFCVGDHCKVGKRRTS